jgi:biopolymer transport protein ExbD
MVRRSLVLLSASAVVVGCTQPQTACAPVPSALLAAEPPASASAPPQPSSRAIAAVTVDLPKAGDFGMPPAALPEATRDVESVAAVAVLDVAADGTLHFNGRKLSSPDQLIAAAKQAHDTDRDLRAVIRADRSASWGNVARAMDLIKQAGIARIAFAVGPPTTPP